MRPWKATVKFASCMNAWSWRKQVSLPRSLSMIRHSAIAPGARRLFAPWNVNQTQHMFMFNQTFPAAGKRELRYEAANQGIDVAEAELEARKLEIAARVRATFYELLRNQDELRLHDEQIALARQAVAAARIKYTVGRVPQQDVLKAQIAVTRLADHLAMFLQDGIWRGHA